MPKDWFVRQDGKIFGPFPSDRLKTMASEGRIDITSEVANENNGPWHPVMKLKGLTFPSANAIPVSPEMPPPRPQAFSNPAPLPIPKSNSSHEQDIWTGRPSQITNIKTFILCGLFFWLVIPIFVALWRYLVVQTIRYELTTQRFRVSWGVLSRNTQELELYRVKDTAFAQSFFQRLFSLATVSMTSSDSSTPYTAIESISASEAKELREKLRTMVEDVRDRKRVREIDYA